MTGAGRQHGYILLPVVLAITLLAAIAFLLNHENSINRKTLHNDMQVTKAEYVAQAGLQHALWQAKRQGCGPYTDITNQALASDSYTTTLTTDLGSTTSYTIAVDQDTWIRSDHPTDNKGTDGQLHIRYEGSNIERPLYRYDLSSISVGSTILSATAWFYVSKAHPEGPVDVHQLTADWTETDATWDTMGANMDSAVIATIPTQPAQDVWVSVNLTTPVQAWVNGQPNYGIALNSTSEGTHGDYASREHGEQPYLEVSVGTPPSSPATLQSVGTLATGVSRGITRNNVMLDQRSQGPLILQPNAAVGKDVFLKEDAASNNHGVSTDLWVEWSGSGAGDNSLLQFDLNGIPRNAKIINATLELYQYWTFTPGGTVGVYRLNRDWVEGSNNGSSGTGATWNEAEPGTNWTTSGGDFDKRPAGTTNITSGTAGDYTWDIKSLVQGWISGIYPNQGLIMTAISAGTLAGFRSSDYSTVTQRPKLTIEYACECGYACLAPQGSGNLLFVVSNPWAMTDGETAKKSLFEDWGYTVTLMSQWDVDWAFDAAAPLNDVVYVSEAVDSTAWGLAPKLAATSLGVINEEGELNDELGMASSFSSPVGNSINITDTSHYITQPFATGNLQIFAGAMEGLTVSGSEAGGLQTLADWGSAGALVVLDTGAALDGGGTAPGRRVMLPVGRDNSDFNWDVVNNNGRLIVQRALQWGSGNIVTGPSPRIILSTAGGATLGGLDFTDKDLAEYEPDTDTATLFLDGGVLGLAQDIDAVHVLANDHIVLSALNTITLGGVSAENEDLIDYDPVNDVAAMLFDGSALFTAGSTDISAAHVMDDGHILLTNEYNATLGGLSFETNDIVEYDPATNTATLFLDGDAVGLSGWIDAVHLLANGHIVLSTDNNASLGGLNFEDGDLVEYDPINDTATLYFDEDLFSGDENVRSVDIGPGSGGDSATGPIAHWKLDETSGTTAVDSEGGHDGGVSGATWTGGIIDGGLAFDGSSDHISVPDDDNLDLVDSFTLSAWINNNEYNMYDLVLNKGDSGTDWNYWFGTIGDEITFGFYQGGYVMFETSNVNLQTNTWYHIAARFDNAADQVKLYLDGIEVYTGSTTLDPPINTGKLYIGRSQDGAYWNGELDDIRIYDQVLSNAEIAELANPSSVGPIAHWKLDDASGSTAVDSVGGHDGDLTNDPTWTTGQLDGALDFDASNDYIDIPHDTTLSLATFSISAWIQPTALSGWQVFVNKGTTTSAVNYYMGTNGDELSLGYYNSGWVEFNTTNVNLSTNQWYHVTATYNDSTREGNIYLNGTLVHTSTAAKSPLPNSDALTIGRSGFGEYWAGMLDDIRIYNRALDAAEVATLAGGGGSAQYVEANDLWWPGSSDTWETVDLASYGVPGDAVVEVAVMNNSGNKENWAGVRAVGSSLERRLQLHEAEGGGNDVVVMHVQADASSIIQTYADDKNSIVFILLGYWTGASYVERFDAFQAGADASWQGHDLGAYGLGPNQVAEITISNTSTSIEWLVGARQSGSSLARRIKLHETEGGGVDTVTMQVETDASSMVEVYAQANSVVDFHVIGYWSTPPGTYTETGGVHGQAVTANTWHQADPSLWGVPANSVAQFLISNEVHNFERELGIRQVGSDKHRVINLQEAEAGGADTASFHVNIDTNTRFEIYTQSGTTDRYFYPLGWWVLQ